VVPPMELQKTVFTFVEDAKVQMTQLISEGKYRSTAMGFITMLEYIRVVILQDAAEMIINGRTHYLFLNPIFSCKLFKDYVKVMTVALDTIHETEKTVDVFSDELDKISPISTTHLIQVCRRFPPPSTHQHIHQTRIIILL
jgi:glutamate racemase